MLRQCISQISLIVLVVFFASCEKQENEQAPPSLIKAVQLLVVQPEGKGQKNTREISGVVSATNISKLSFRVDGQVTKITVKRGDRVKKGKALASLQLTEYTTALNIAKASYDAAKSNLAIQEKSLDRHRKLYSKLLISTSDMESAERNYSRAAADAQIQKGNLQNARDGFSNTVLKAPFNGAIADIHVDPLAEVKSGQTIITLQDAEKFEVSIFIPETLITTIAKDNIVKVKIPSLANKALKGTISEIGAQAQDGAYKVVITLNQTNLRLFSGMTAIAYFSYISSTDNIYLVPTNAIDLRYYNENKKTAPLYVYVSNIDAPNQGTLHLREVVINDMRENMLEVVSGLNPGDLIVVAGTSYLSNGQVVKPWQEKLKSPLE